MKICIGIPSDDLKVNDFQQAAIEIAEKLTTMTGGLAWNYCQGTWIPSAESLDSCGPYSGEIERDITAWYSILYHPKMDDDIYTFIQTEIRAIVTKYELPIKYVHVEKSNSTALHFIV